VVGGRRPAWRRSRGAARPIPGVPEPAGRPAMSEREVFFQALDRDDPAERAAFLDEACAGDASLRQRVDALLRSHAKAGDFLGTPAPQQLAAGGGAPAGRPENGGPPDFLAPAPRAGPPGPRGAVRGPRG